MGGTCSCDIMEITNLNFEQDPDSNKATKKPLFIKRSQHKNTKYKISFAQPKSEKTPLCTSHPITNTEKKCTQIINNQRKKSSANCDATNAQNGGCTPIEYITDISDSDNDMNMDYLADNDMSGLVMSSSSPAITPIPSPSALEIVRCVQNNKQTHSLLLRNCNEKRNIHESPLRRSNGAAIGEVYADTNGTELSSYCRFRNAKPNNALLESTTILFFSH